MGRVGIESGRSTAKKEQHERRTNHRWLFWLHRSSITSPTTFKMRPRTSGPTGTMMGPRVLMMGVPRARPSVESMEMQRTSLLPSFVEGKFKQRKKKF